MGFFSDLNSITRYGYHRSALLLLIRFNSEKYRLTLIMVASIPNLSFPSISAQPVMGNKPVSKIRWLSGTVSRANIGIPFDFKSAITSTSSQSLRLLDIRTYIFVSRPWDSFLCTHSCPFYRIALIWCGGITAQINVRHANTICCPKNRSLKC